MRSESKNLLKLTVRPLEPKLWPALEDLFGRCGASNGCWCMYWRIGPDYHKRRREMNKATFKQIVKRGPPPGLIAYQGDLAVGWCQVTPRDALPWLTKKTAGAAANEQAVWSISCFYVRRGYRKQAVTAALIRTAIETAKQAKAGALEAYPVDTSAPTSTSNLFTGVASTFTRAGFEAVAHLGRHRLIMRHDLERGV